MKPKDKKQFEKELLNYIKSKKFYKNPEEARAIMRATFEKRIYEKTKKLH